MTDGRGTTRKEDMRRLERTVFTVLMTVGLTAVSAVASAQTDESNPAEPDTLFDFGYDVVNRALLWGTSRLDGPYDCSVENGPLTVTYGATSADGVILVDLLEDASGVVVFPNRPVDEVGEGQEPATSPIAYSGSAGACGLIGGDPTGPQGQINHGMFMRLFNSLYSGDENGRGCLVRHLAQSDLGKGDQQVQAGEMAPDPVAPGSTGSVELTTVETDCEHGRDTQSADQVSPGRPEGAGPPDHAGRPEDAGPPDHAGRPDDIGGPGNGNGGGPGN